PVETTGVPKPQSAERTFPLGRHPIGDKGAIFKEIAAEWNGDVIQDPADVSRFFDTLQDRTAGLVILDFIDIASWDQIEGHAFDTATGYLELYWHDFRAIDAERRPLRTGYDILLGKPLRLADSHSGDQNRSGSGRCRIPFERPDA